MGTLLELYRSPDGPAALATIRALDAAWKAGQAYDKVREQLGVDKLGLPAGTEEVVFESKRTALCPTDHKLGSLLYFMSERGLPLLWEVFGFEAPEPEPPDHYRIPDWPATLVKMRACRAALAAAAPNPVPLRDADTITPGHARFDMHAHVQHQIDTQREDLAQHRAMLDAFEEMIEWVLEQPEPRNFLVCWSW